MNGKKRGDQETSDAMRTERTEKKHLRPDTGRYKRYAEAKAKIPKHLSAEEYEAEVKRLAKKYNI